MSEGSVTKEDKALGYARTPVFHNLIRSQCEYCGMILISVQAKLEELEREHRVVCRRARSVAAGS